MRRLMQADTRLHRIDQHGVRQQQPESSRADSLSSREARFRPVEAWGCDVAAALFGFGIGGVLTLLPIAWADYFGRANFAAIRSIALTAQVLAQAAGPLLSGALHDWTGNYRLSLQCFALLSFLSILAALTARQPVTIDCSIKTG